MRGSQQAKILEIFEVFIRFLGTIKKSLFGIKCVPELIKNNASTFRNGVRGEIEFRGHYFEKKIWDSTLVIIYKRSFCLIILFIKMYSSSCIV